MTSPKSDLFSVVETAETTPSFKEEVKETTVSSVEKPEEVKEISAEDKKLAETFQRITKQESHIKAERAKIEEARKAFEAEKEKAEKYNSLLNKSPFEILEHFGITYEKLLEADTERHNPVDPNVKKALQAVEELKSQLSTKEEEALRERRTRAELQIKSEISRTIKENDFDVIEKLGAEDAVIEYMEEVYAQTQEIPDYKEACQAINDKIVEQYRKVSNSKWLQQKEEASEPVAEKTISPTLTNKMTQSSVSRDKPMTETQRFQAALAALSK